MNSEVGFDLVCSMFGQNTNLIANAEIEFEEMTSKKSVSKANFVIYFILQ